MPVRRQREQHEHRQDAQRHEQRSNPEGSTLALDTQEPPATGNGESGDRKAFPYLRTEFDERHGRFSPDGRSLVTKETHGKSVALYRLPQ